LLRRRSVDRLTPSTLHVARSDVDALIAAAASISRSRRTRGSRTPGSRAPLPFSDVLKELESSDLALKLSILHLQQVITALKIVLCCALLLATRFRLRVEITAVAFATPGVELRRIDPLAAQVGAHLADCACVGLTHDARLLRNGESSPLRLSKDLDLHFTALPEY